MVGNLYETGRVIELRKVITVKALPDGKGVEVGDSDLHGEEATMSFTDPRFTTQDIQPGDIVRMHDAGPSLGRVEEIFREGLRIFPARKTHRARLVEHATFRKNLRSKTANDTK